MREPGLDRHDWESEWASLEAEIEDSPRETLPALGDLVERTVRERGIPAGEGGRRGHGGDLRDAPRGARDRGPRGSRRGRRPGDVAAAVNLYREVYDHMLAELRE